MWGVAAEVQDPQRSPYRSRAYVLVDAPLYGGTRTLLMQWQRLEVLHRTYSISPHKRCILIESSARGYMKVDFLGQAEVTSSSLGSALGFIRTRREPRAEVTSGTNVDESH